MNDLISRKTALETIDGRIDMIRAFIEKENMGLDEAYKYHCEIHGLYNAKELIECLPSAQKTGKWIDQHKCSNCGFSDVRSPKYCCRCGSLNGGENE